MSQFHPEPPAAEDLPKLYLALLRRVERLEGALRQLWSDGVRDNLRPTLRDIQEIKADIDRLRKSIRKEDA
jgi:hypothetical protein